MRNKLLEHSGGESSTKVEGSALNGSKHGIQARRQSMWVQIQEL